MEQRIQYAQTKEGVSIILWAVGEGKSVVYMPRIASHQIELGWQVPGVRRLPAPRGEAETS